MCPKGSERRDRQVVCQSDAERHGPEPCLDSLQAFGFVQFTVWKNLRVATPFTQLRSWSLLQGLQTTKEGSKGETEGRKESET